jgi:hypothetical protein
MAVFLRRFELRVLQTRCHAALIDYIQAVSGDVCHVHAILRAWVCLPTVDVCAQGTTSSSLKGLLLSGNWEVEMAALVRLTELAVLRMHASTIVVGGFSALELSLPRLRWLQLDRVAFPSKSPVLQVKHAYLVPSAKM